MKLLVNPDLLTCPVMKPWAAGSLHTCTCVPGFEDAHSDCAISVPYVMSKRTFSGDVAVCGVCRAKLFCGAVSVLDGCLLVDLFTLQGNK